MLRCIVYSQLSELEAQEAIVHLTTLIKLVWGQLL